MSETQTASSGTAAIEAAAAALTQGQKPVEPTATTTTQGEPATVDEAALGDAGKKALKAERDARAAAEKQAADLKAKLDKIEAANMSDLERAQKEAAEAKAEVEKVPAMVAEHLRAHLKEIHQISDENADLYLTSTDPATLLKQAIGIAPRTSAAPQPDLSQAAHTAPALNSDGLTEALARAVGAS